MVEKPVCGQQGVCSDQATREEAKVTCVRCKAIIENTNFNKATDYEWSHDHGLLVYNGDSGTSVLIAHYQDFYVDVDKAVEKRLMSEGLAIGSDLFED